MHRFLPRCISGPYAGLMGDGCWPFVMVMIDEEKYLKNIDQLMMIRMNSDKALEITTSSHVEEEVTAKKTFLSNRMSPSCRIEWSKWTVRSYTAEWPMLAAFIVDVSAILELSGGCGASAPTIAVSYPRGNPAAIVRMNQTLVSSRLAYSATLGKRLLKRLLREMRI